MTESMVEKVAQAIYDALGRQPEEDARGRAMGRPYLSMEGGYTEEGEPFPEGLDRVNIDGHVDLTAVARAAIEAMREPTEAMVAAYIPATKTAEIAPGLNETFTPLGSYAQNNWRRMIDAALSPGEQDG